MPTQNVNLSDQQAKFIRRTVGKGRCRNASEVVRAGLRLLEQQEQEQKLKLDTLRRLGNEAFAEIDRGEFEAVAIEGIDQFMARTDAKARASRPR